MLRVFKVLIFLFSNRISNYEFHYNNYFQRGIKFFLEIQILIDCNFKLSFEIGKQNSNLPAIIFILSKNFNFNANLNLFKLLEPFE